MDFLQELAQGLYERRDQAVLVPFRDCSGPGFTPVAQDCHRNVDLWCRARSEHKPVRGWLVLEGYPDPDVWRFVAHSIVEDQRGRLSDPTPSIAAQKYPFLRAAMAEDEYLLLLSARGLIYVDHRRPSQSTSSFG
jgi:hypothetical protein